MKRPTWRFYLGIVGGVLTGLWAVERLPILRGGMHFPEAATVKEQLAATTSLALKRTPSNRRDTVLGFRQAFERCSTWAAREALLKEVIEDLLPEDWQQAMQLFLEFNRGSVDEALLGSILREGGREAFQMALASRTLSMLQLGNGLRLGKTPNRMQYISEILPEAKGRSHPSASLIAAAYDGTDVSLDELTSTASLFVDRFGGMGFRQLVGRHFETHDESEALEILEAFKPLAKNGSGSDYESVTENPEIVDRRSL